MSSPPPAATPDQKALKTEWAVKCRDKTVLAADEAQAQRWAAQFDDDPDIVGCRPHRVVSRVISPWSPVVDLEGNPE